MNIELTLAEVRAVRNTRPRDPEGTRTILPNTSPATRVAASRRFAALAIQAFRASPEASALPSTSA